MNLFTHGLLSIVVLVVILFLMFRMAQSMITRFVSSVNLNKHLTKLLFFIELVTWFILMYRIAEDFKHEKPVLSLIAAALLILSLFWVFLFLLKDYFAGMYFRVFEDYKLNTRISFDDISGSINAFESRYLVLQTSQGLLKLPYSSLFRVKIHQLSEKNQEELKLLLSVKKADINNDFVENLRKKILLMPWINIQYKAEITVLDRETENVSIKLVLLDSKYKKDVEKYLMS